MTGIVIVIAVGIFVASLAAFAVSVLIPGVRLRLLFFSGVTAFHISNCFLVSVKFHFLPIMFLVFFDMSALVDPMLASVREKLRRGRHSSEP